MVPPTLGLYSGLVEVLARQRVLLYVVAGLVVLGVGAWGLFSGEGGAESGGRLVVEPLPASFGEDSSGQAPSRLSATLSREQAPGTYPEHHQPGDHVQQDPLSGKNFHKPRVEPKGWRDHSTLVPAWSSLIA